MSELIDLAPLWFPEMAAMFCLILASGFFSGSETALFYLSHDELRGLRAGKKRERAVAELLSDADRLLTAVLFWNLVINLTYFSVSIVVTQRLAHAGHTTAGGIYGIASLLAIILLGEVLPKTLAVAFRRPLASLVSLPLASAVRVLDPITPTFQTITRLAHRTFWPHLEREPFLQAEDLERAVEATESSGDVIRHERQILHNILDLSEITVEEVMRPRGTYLSLESPIHLAYMRSSVPEADYLMIHRHGTEEIESAIPLAGFSTIPETHLETAAEDIVHVPWCADLAYTLQLLRDRFCSVASVVNEYGETIGIVTYEDIVDTILMPQPSRAKRLLKREPVLEIAPGRFHVEGITTLRYLSKRLDIDYEPSPESQITVAGMLYEELEHIPIVGDECAWNEYWFKVIDVSRRGQLRVMVSKK